MFWRTTGSKGGPVTHPGKCHRRLWVGSRRSPCNGQRPVTPGLLPFGRNVSAALGIDMISPDPCGTRNAGEKAPCPAPASHWAASVPAVAHHPAPAALRRNRNPTRLQPRRALRPQERTSAGCIVWTPGAVNTGLASSSLAVTFAPNWCGRLVTVPSAHSRKLRLAEQC